MKKRSIIVALCGDDEWGNKPYKSKKYNPKALSEAYAHLFLTAEKNHIKFVKTSYDWYNKETNNFEKGWIYNEKLGWIKRDQKFKADVIFDKVLGKTKRVRELKKLFSRRKKLFNPMYIEKICTDKYETYKNFKTLSPRTFKVDTKTQLKENLKKIRGNKVVFKPDQGSSGRGIIICKKEDLLKKVKEIKEPMVLQEFIECNKSNRIRIHYGVYDIRVVLSQGKIIESYIRASKNKKILTSNIALGGKMIFIHKESLPKQIMKDIDLIEKKFKNYKSRLYTADFMIDKHGKVWLVELNDKPGILIQKQSYAYKKRREKISHAIVKNMEEYA